MDSRELTKNLYAMIPVINHKLFRELPSTDIPKQQLRLLHVLSHHENMPIKHFCEKMHISKPNMTKLVDQLMSEGWVNRSHSEEDRRVVLLNLTEEGQQVMSDHYEVLITESCKMFDDFTEEEKESLNYHLSEVVRLMEKVKSSKERK